MQYKLLRVVSEGWGGDGSWRLSGAARIACKPLPYENPTDAMEIPQRGLQGHERGLWYRIGGS